mmetsp:Transcript_142509/g.443180  ORF Transcript_142509/g.443180 Transcript_142509/m.443180 type:complete len:162 (+) Transcript_142509:1762-2247(+)
MAAWTVEPAPPESFRPATLVPVEDPRLCAPPKSVARRRAEEYGLAVWRVAHRPRIAARDRPSTEGKIVEAFYADDELVLTGQASGPWFQLSALTWPDVTYAPPEAWVLSDGSSIGLGVLLEQVYDPAEEEARRAAAAAPAAEDFAEDSDVSSDEELLAEGT